MRTLQENLGPTLLQTLLSPQDYRSAQAAKLERRAAKAQNKKSWTAINDWRDWLRSIFPAYVKADFAPRHVDFWQWVWSIKAGERPRPFIAVWPRGGGKSVSAELAACAIGLRGIRQYALYVSGTQEQADKHLAALADPLERAGVERAINRYGSSRGWRRNRLHTDQGFVIDALGLDTAIRGIRLEDKRPDLIVFDDLDALEDTSVTVTKKIDRLTQTVLPTGSNDCAVMGVQNLIHADSIFSKIVEGRVDFLSDRIISGPYVALEGFECEQTPAGIKITAGEPTWAGQDVEACQNFINSSGLRAFKRECQHMTKEDVLGALWQRKTIEMFRVVQPPDLTLRAVALDPSLTSKDSSDECGIMAGGRDRYGHGFVLMDYTLRAAPSEWATRAISAAIIHNAQHIVYETNAGGELVPTVIRGITRDAVADDLERLGYSRDRARAGKDIPLIEVHASRGKETRAEPTSSEYSLGHIHHVGVLPALEDEQCSWIPGTGRSPNRVDALVWLMTDLIIGSATDIDDWIGHYEKEAGQALEVPPGLAPAGLAVARPPLGNTPFRIG